MFVSFLNVQYTPPILSSLHISFMCSQSISTLIKKVSTFNNAQSILLDSYVLLDLYSRWLPICFQPREWAWSLKTKYEMDKNWQSEYELSEESKEYAKKILKL